MGDTPARSKAKDQLGFGLPALGSPPENAGLALDQLSAALAGMLNQGDDPYRVAPVATSTVVEAPSPAPAPAAESNASDTPADACEITPRAILEAMLFVGSPNNEPLTSQQVAGLMRGVRPAEIDALVRELNFDYAARRCPYAIVAEGAGYRLVLSEEHAALRDRFHGRNQQARLSQAAIEILAAVAYHQPITAEDVTRLRGASSGHLLAQLVRRQLLKVERTDDKPRKTIYSTTQRFLELFGLESLAELPRSQDLDET